MGEKDHEFELTNGKTNGDVAVDEKKELVKHEEEEEGYVKPPDGGWGWMVVLSSFLIHVIADGVVYSFGVFLTEFVDVFDAGRGEVSWVGSLQPAVCFTVGPLSSALTNRFGCRAVTIAGALIAGAGFILSMFATSLYFLYFSAGIMAGVGFGLIYLPAIVCVAQYFEKKRSFATGLAVCGSGFGTMILAPLTKLLVFEFKWEGAMLILGGIILNIVVCGIIFRPLEAPIKESNSCSSDSSSSKSSSEEERLLDPPVVKILPEDKKNGGAEFGDIHALVERNPDPSRQRGEGEVIVITAEGLERSSSQANGSTGFIGAIDSALLDDDDNSADATLSATSLEDKSDRLGQLPERHRKTSLDLTAGHRIAASQSLTPHISDSAKELAAAVRSESALHKTAVRQRNPRTHHTSDHHDHHPTTANTLAPLTRKDIFYSGSLLNIPMYRSQPDVYKAAVTTSGHHEHDDTEKEAGGSSRCPCVGDEFKQTMTDMLSFGLLKNPVFLMFAISNFFTSIGFNMPFIFLPDRAIQSGIDKDRATMLVSVIGFANTAGRIIFGALSDRPWVNRLMLYNTALTICGVATAVSAAIGNNYILLVTYAAVFGVFIGVYVSLTSVVLVDLLGLEYLTNSFGLLLLFQGAATFIGPPIAGWLFDATGRYDISFIAMGTLIAISGAMLYFLPLVERIYQRRLSKETVAHDREMGQHTVLETTENHVA